MAIIIAKVSMPVFKILLPDTKEGTTFSGIFE
jgi:hypothetical protein